jgi:tRNA pseudouridine38-40 synthase
MPEARTFRITIAYDGTEFQGFQVQKDRRTIQGEIERALHKLTQQAIRVAGAGRTDAGVHAYGQVVSFRSAWRHPVSDLERALNAVLPPDISVRDLEQVEESFHARYSAQSREYLYRLYNSPVRLPHLERYAWRLRQDLEPARLAIATAMVIGEADFGAFGQAVQGRSTVRRVYRAEWLATPCKGWAGSGWEFWIEANGFLRGMVRRMVSTLVDVGLGALEPETFHEILCSRDPAKASALAPAQGLFFWRARYPQDGKAADDRSRALIQDTER